MTAAGRRSAIASVRTTSFGVALSNTWDDSGFTNSEVEGLICFRVPSYGRKGAAISLRSPNVYDANERIIRPGATSSRAGDRDRCRRGGLCHGNSDLAGDATYGGTVGDSTSRGDTVAYDAIRCSESDSNPVLVLWAPSDGAGI